MLVTRLGRESGSMIREMATLGYFLIIATMAGVVSKGMWEVSHDGLTVNVLCLVDINLANSELTVRGLSSAVAAREIVDDKSSNLVATDVLDGVFDSGNLGASVAKDASVWTKRSELCELTSRGKFQPGRPW
jgi:hypothetical protein